MPKIETLIDELCLGQGTSRLGMSLFFAKRLNTQNYPIYNQQSVLFFDISDFRAMILSDLV